MAHNSRPSKSRPSKSRPSKSRPSKMGRKWTQDDVLAYNIKVVYEDLTTFFGVTDLPPPNVENDALTALPAQHSNAAHSHSISNMLFYMGRLATNPVPHIFNIESLTIQFVKELFSLFHYEDVKKGRFVMTRPTLGYMESQGRPPQLDICIRDISHAILLVVKADRRSRGFNPEPRLISDAIGAFHNDNIMREKHLGIDPLTSMVMPGIVMHGTMPTFYKIPITPELVRAVESGERPEQETVVHAYHPEVPRPEEGMKPLDNRSILLSCFECFRQFL